MRTEVTRRETAMETASSGPSTHFFIRYNLNLYCTSLIRLSWLLQVRFSIYDLGSAMSASG